MMTNYILATKTTLKFNLSMRKTSLASITKNETSDEEFCSGTSEIMLIVTSQFWHLT